MAELTKEQLDEGKKVLGGVTIFFWVVGALIAVGLFSFNNLGSWAKDFSMGPFSIGFPAPNATWIFLALYVVALVGFHIRKGWAVPVGRAGLVVAMVIFFPVGTIFGAILWKRINDPVAKRYLNYGEAQEEKSGAISAEISPSAGAEPKAEESKPEVKPEESGGTAEDK